MTQYKEPTGVQKIALDTITRGFDALRDSIKYSVPYTRRSQIALTHLETAEMFAKKAIVHGDDE